MKNLPLTLVSFATHSYREAVSKKLTSLGYPVEVLCTQPYERQLDNLKGILVFLIGKQYSAREWLLAAFSDIRKNPRFGIFIKEETDWDVQILEYCNEFSSWPCSREELALRLDRLCKKTANSTQSETERLLIDDLGSVNIVGKSPMFQQTIQRIKKFALCDAPVLIEGETGTGKELVARAIHYLGQRQGYPFIPVNCGALPDNLIENELFGHEKGAFTDAKTSYCGLINQAEGGTLFLDEVEALSLKGQVTLLRFLQDQQYRPLGSKCLMKANVRIIAATNNPLSQLIKSGEFRQDLLFRLNIMPIVLPPLRERRGDIELLAEHFVHMYCVQYNQPNKYLHQDTIEWMKRYEWPGNVRELENFVHREFLLAENDVIHVTIKLNSSLPDNNTVNLWESDEFLSASFNEAKDSVIQQFEKRYLSELMAGVGGNVTHAAKIAGKERRALGKLLKKYGLTKEQFH